MPRRRRRPCPTASPAFRNSPISPASANAAALFKSLRYDGRYTPPSLQGSLAYPSTAGGVEWGGGAVDPRSGIYVVNSSYVAQIYRLIKRADYEQQTRNGTPHGYLPADRRAVRLLPEQFCQFPRHALLESALRHAVGLRSQQRQAAVEEAVRRSPEMGLLHAEILGLGDDRRAADHQIGPHLHRRLDGCAGARDRPEIRRRSSGKRQVDAPAVANPATYIYKGKQYVVFVAGGNAILKPQASDQATAFALK